MPIPVPSEQQSLVKPLVERAFQRGYDFGTLSMIIGIAASELQSIYEGRGTDNFVTWHCVLSLLNSGD